MSRSVRSLRLPIVLLLVTSSALAACDDRQDEGVLVTAAAAAGPDGEPLVLASVEDWCLADAAVRCDLFTRCPLAPWLGRLESLHCEAAEAAWCLGVTVPSVEAGRADLNLQAAADFLDFAAGITCEAYHLETVLEAWRELRAKVFAGHVATGDPCYLNAECGAPDSICGGDACPGVCKVRGQIGESCEGACTLGAWCDGGTCEAWVDSGDVCDSSSACPLGHMCMDHACTPVALEGDPCDAFADTCVMSTCAGGVCAPLPGPGQACEWVVGCGEGYCDPTDDVCKAPALQGDPCDFLDVSCAPGLTCLSSLEICVPIGQEGDLCSEKLACASTHCVDGQCAAVAPPAEVCTLACEPGETWCEGDAVVTCGPDGFAAPEPAQVCGGGQVCEAGACVADEPDCSLSCTSDSFSYSCGSSSSTSSYSYCSNGNPSFVTVSYSNGHTVWCDLSCSGFGGSCEDDTGAWCSLW